MAGDTHIELGYKDTGAFFVYDCEGESFSLIAIGQEQPQNANYNARCTAIHAAGAAHKAAFGANGAVKNITILKKASLEQPSIHGKRLNEVQIRQTQPTPKKLSLGKKKKPQKRRAKPRHSMRELEMRNVHTASRIQPNSSPLQAEQTEGYDCRRTQAAVPEFRQNQRYKTNMHQTHDQNQRGRESRQLLALFPENPYEIKIKIQRDCRSQKKENQHTAQT